jgi:hypothetical protein
MLTRERILEISSVHPLAEPIESTKEFQELCTLALRGLAAQGVSEALDKTRVRFEHVLCKCDAYRNGKTLQEVKEALAKYRAETEDGE